MRLSPRALAALVALAVPAAAETHLVPQDHATILAAVLAAADGDTILVSAGTYPEAVKLPDRNGLTIRGKGKVVIEPPGDIGIELTDCHDCVLEKLRVVGGNPFGISLQNCTNIHVGKCVIEGAVQVGLRTDFGSGHVIEGCVVTGAGTDGIALGSGTANETAGCHVSKCRIDDAGNNGLSFVGTGQVIEKCTVTRAGNNGFVIGNVILGQDNVFSRCKVIEPEKNGFAINGNRNVCDHCTVTKAGEDGVVLISGDENEVIQCTVVDATDNGVTVSFTTSKTQVISSRITRPGDTGLVGNGDVSMLVLNRISNAGVNGMAIGGDGSDYNGNRISGSASNGVWLQLSAQDNVLANNKASGSQGFDLLDESVDANIVDITNSFKTVGP